MSWGLRSKLRTLVQAYRAKSRYNVGVAIEYDKAGPGGKEHATKFRHIAALIDEVIDSLDRILEEDEDGNPKFYVGIEYSIQKRGFVVFSDEVSVLVHGETLISAFDTFCEALETQIESFVEVPRASVYPGKAVRLRQVLTWFPKDRIFDPPTKKFHSGTQIMKTYIKDYEKKCPHCGEKLES